MAYPYTSQPTYSVVPAQTTVYSTQPAYDPAAYAPPTATQQYAAAPAPQYGAPAYSQYGSRDEIRTIFITGFPPDLKDRELPNLCRFLPGFEAASMKSSAHGVQQGFVLFQYGQAAHQALTSINGVDFGDGCILRAEMARKNMYVRSDSERPSKQYRTDAGPAPGGPPSGGGHYVDRNADNPPCDTLFIGNLSSAVPDEDINAYFRNLKGDMFVGCKVNRNNHRVSAFVQFVDIPTAQDVHASEQGKELPGSDRGPMRIQFSKNALGEFGKRRREEAAYAAAQAAAQQSQQQQQQQQYQGLPVTSASPHGPSYAPPAAAPQAGPPAAQHAGGQYDQHQYAQPDQHYQAPPPQ